MTIICFTPSSSVFITQYFEDHIMDSLKLAKLTLTILISILILAISNTAGASKSSQKLIPEETQTRIIRPFPRPRPSQIQIHVKSLHKDANKPETEVPAHDSTITLNKDLKGVELVCRAPHPIKWEFLVNEASVSVFT